MDFKQNVQVKCPQMRAKTKQNLKSKKSPY